MDWRGALARARVWLTKERIYKGLRGIFRVSLIVLIADLIGFVLLSLLGYIGFYLMIYGLGVSSDIDKVVGQTLVVAGVVMLIAYTVLTIIFQRRRDKRAREEKSRQPAPEINYGFQLTFLPVDDNDEDTAYIIGMVMGEKMEKDQVAFMLGKFAEKLAGDAQQEKDLGGRVN